jgi:IclR family transcriptional regulator, acetate operon repressor
MTAEPALFSLRAVERVCDILDLLQMAPDGFTLSDLAERTQLPKSTAYRYLVALENRGYVDREDNVMRIGPAFRSASRFDQFLEVAQPILVKLRDQIEETVNLGTLDGSQLTHALVVESQQMMRLAARAGEKGNLHSTAIGKVIAARMDPDEVRTILAEQGLPPVTDRTITSIDTYMAELQRVRRQGYALDDCENQDQGRCIAVPIEGIPVLAGVSISAPTSRFPKRRVVEFAESLHRTAEELAQEYDVFRRQQTAPTRESR